MKPLPVGMKRVTVNESGHPVGEGHHFARLLDADVDLVHALLDAGMSYATVAVKMEVSKSCIAHIATGRRRCQTIAQIRVVPLAPMVVRVPAPTKASRAKRPALPLVPVNEAALLLQQAMADWR